LKIDRSIVAPLIESPEQGRLVEAIVEMAQALEIGVIAEGIETMEHAQIVMRLGCPILQGYAFAKPLPEAEAVSFCQTKTRLRVA
jgi:EAL domain-containing protein (putative c-di-GMP-specific phosphodiesterase class I)